MKEKKRGIEINIKLSNKAIYTLIVIGILAILGVGVFALGSVSNPGHAISELQTCEEGETLQVVDGEWDCVDKNNFIGEIVIDEEVVMWESPISIQGASGNLICSAYLPNIIYGSGVCISAWNSLDKTISCSDTSLGYGGRCFCQGLRKN
jgi:hypothetical protein